LWKKWVDLTVNESKRNNDYSIIIDKFSRKCYVYFSGKRKYEFDAELGRNWVGDKRVKGDKATPEGMYKITRKFDSRKTKYYKALLLDYPNEEDTARFRAEIANGSLPRNAKIGGLIEIHGNGGKGIDWTEGCVALTDREMDVIFKIAKVGTPVTIVGSLTDLDTVVSK
jgi:murein L,D-transpeptidase YafK